MVQKAAYRKRVVVWQINLKHICAIKLLTGFPSGWSGMGKQQLVARVIFLQALNQTGRCACFTDRHGMQPDYRFVAVYCIKTEALGDMFEIFRLSARAPHQVEKNIG